MAKVLGIVAGQGQFPVLVARGAREQGYSIAMIGLDGNVDPDTRREADVYTTINVGQLGKLIDFMHKQGAAEVCFAGAVKKPKALDVRPDMRTVKLFFSLRSRGDDSLLRSIAGELDKEGLKVISASRFAPSLLAPSGVQTSRSPTAEEWEEIRFGWPVAQALGRMDIGQTIVVCEKIVVAVEALEGTDAALERAGKLRNRGCVAIKIFKPGQDSRMDQPAMGPKTLSIMAAHGYICLAYQARDALFFDLDLAVSIADAANIAIVGLSPDGELVDS